MEDSYTGFALTPVDDEPQSTRRSSSQYAATVRYFWRSEPKTQEIDFRKEGIKGQTLRVGLMKAIADEGLVGKVTVSVHESTGKAYLKKV